MRKSENFVGSKEYCYCYRGSLHSLHEILYINVERQASKIICAKRLKRLSCLQVLYSITHLHNWFTKHTCTHKLSLMITIPANTFFVFSGFGNQLKSSLQGWLWAPRERKPLCLVMSKHFGLSGNRPTWYKGRH